MSASLTKAKPLRQVCVRLGAVLIGLALALGAAEIIVRKRDPQALERISTVHTAGANESPLHPAQGLFEIDSELGFTPDPNGPFVEAHMCAPNDYPLVKEEGTTRLLFVGDSVTKRAAIVTGLKQVWGEAGIEYWNAGVEGYALHQTDLYHSRFLTGLDADHVLFTFHLNDFTATPVAFLDGDRLVVHQTELSSAKTNRWLFERSHLYRLWLSRKLTPGAENSLVPQPDLVQEAEESLVALRDRVEAGGARFSVLLLPWLSPTGEWPERAEVARREALAILERHAIETFDLLRPLEEALTAGEVVRERPRDPEHPSSIFGLRCARALAAMGLTAD
ncbi:MAG: hypothetical protein ACI8QS_002304 [Planctomycetota bacterium]|jgi:hypothetical protein